MNIFCINIAILMSLMMTLISCEKKQSIQNISIDKSDQVIGPQINIAQISEMGDYFYPFRDALGHGAFEGANLYFEKINKEGGVNGRVIKILPRHIPINDDFEVKKYTKELLKDKDIFSFAFSYCFVQTTTISEALKGTGIPLLFPMSGVQNKAENVFYIRPSYSDEGEEFMQKPSIKFKHDKKVAHVTQREEICYFAKDMFYSKQANKNTKIASDNYFDIINSKTDKKSFEEAKNLVKKLKKENIETMILFATGKGAYLLRLFKNYNYNPTILTFSLFISEKTLDLANPNIKNFFFASPLPIPSVSRELEIVQELEKLMHESGLKKKATSAMLEGYLGAKVFVEVLRKVGPELTRRKFIHELKLIKNQNFGGINIDFSKDGFRGNPKAYIYRYDDKKIKLISN